MIRVLLVDDHAMVRTGIAAMLAVTDDIEVVGQAADGARPPWPRSRTAARTSS